MNTANLDIPKNSDKCNWCCCNCSCDVIPL